MRGIMLPRGGCTVSGPDGKKKWDVQTGDIPAHIVFTTRPLQEKDGEEDKYSFFGC